MATAPEPVLPRRRDEQIGDAVLDARDRIESAGSEVSEDVAALLADIRASVADGVKSALEGEGQRVNYAPAFALGVVFGVVICVVVLLLALWTFATLMR